MSRGRNDPRRVRRRKLVGFVSWLLVMLVSLSVVTWRQTKGIALERELRELESELAITETRRVELVRRIQQLESRSRVVRAARERLGMYLPDDHEIILLPVPASGMDDEAARGGRE